MKTVKMLAIGLLFMWTASMHSQVSVNVNIGTPPVWASTAPAHVEFYYLPEIEVYYDVPRQQYIYLNDGAWIHAEVLPTHYRGYDLYHSQPVYLVDYKGRKPYVHFKKHKIKYKGKGHYKGHHGKGKKKGHGKKH